MSKLDLEAYAKEHITYEIRTLIASSYFRQTRNPKDQSFVTNALYVAFCTHARQISDFLRNGGPGNTIRAKDYIPKRISQGKKPDWARNVDDKIVHLGKERISNFTISVEEILQNLEKELWEFYDNLPHDKKDWFLVIPECFPKQKQNE